ncbi:Sporulation initiation phosphotransferase F [Posidoniimonas polymericola]|uniref:Sporulation initiation phosphotransferase F n=1 Tax=Posidoniimonas polymericola TaxID=2528002 RepID=A0A5C5YMX7_9BACT|nr:response regulator [Posidoniimonas polymericola]TWT76138.1 Sporulation initiation phosphotransferase F [Posidoniimonas polymericola]
MTLTPQTPPRALIAEDDPALADVLKLAFTRKGFQTKVFRNGRDALAAAAAESWDVVCSDYQMPHVNGEQLLTGVRASETSRHAVCILCSAKSYELNCERMARELNLHAIFYKPFSLAEITESAQQGLASRAPVA